MPGLSRHLKQLEKELLALGEETMLLEELDGFIAGLLVCPDLIKPGEWLPLVWGRDSADPQPAFDDLDHVNRVLGLIMEHYNGVARILMDRPERYSPLMAIDARNGDILWEIWIEGFDKVIELRPATWQKLLDTDADTVAAMRGIMTLADLARGDHPDHSKYREAFTATAPDDIAHWVVTLNSWRLANYKLPQAIDSILQPSFDPARKIGRNDPCPFGSGKKYKRCCGLH